LIGKKPLRKLPSICERDFARDFFKNLNLGGDEASLLAESFGKAASEVSIGLSEVLHSTFLKTNIYLGQKKMRTTTH